MEPNLGYFTSYINNTSINYMNDTTIKLFNNIIETEVIL